MNFTLEELGWHHLNHPMPKLDKTEFLARICFDHQKLYDVLYEHGICQAVLPGIVHFKTPENLPTIGDWVIVKREPSGINLIQTVLPRKSKFSRKTPGKRAQEQLLAANIDRVFLLFSLTLPINPNLIERFLVLAGQYRVAASILLTKKDLCDTYQEALSLIKKIAPNCPVHPICTQEITSDTFTNTLGYIKPNETIAFMGPSGVGKSTLLNQLIGFEKQRTNRTRNDEKGRHTTTHRELIKLPQGGLVIDTPGIKEIQPWDPEKGLSEAFHDIMALSTCCKFNNCSHTHEPGCRVKSAIEEGLLHPKRVENYLKIKMEHTELKKELDKRKKK